MHIVFLHGLLGVPQEFMSIAARLNCPTEMISLPGHGCSDAIVDFSNVNEWLDEQLIGLKIKDFILYGYSLGGRIALNYACTAKTKLKPKAVIIESAAIGLATKSEKDERLQKDQEWAKQFASGNMREILTNWYNQPVFNDLSIQDKEFLINKRCKNNGPKIATVLESLSLAKMPFLGGNIKELAIPMLYLYGALDDKFKAVATKLIGYNNNLISVKEIPTCGHNCHLNNSNEISQLIKDFTNTIEKQ